MAPEDNIDLPIDVREGTATTPPCWCGCSCLVGSPRGGGQRFEWLAMADRVLEIPVNLQGVVHLLVVRALGVEDLV
jgi:hypothetical protein